MLKDTNKTLLRMPSINAKFGAVFYFSVLVVSGLLLCATSIAQDEGKLSRDTQAHLLTKLWMETCAVHFSQPDEIRSIAKKYRFTENPPHAKVFNFLSGEKGMVWDVSLGPHAQNVLVLLDNGHSCRVHARRAASWRINETFEKVLQGIKTPGISVDRISETNIEKDGVTRGYKKVCVNGHLAGDCHPTRRNHDRRQETITPRPHRSVARQLQEA